ncbi:MAG: branched-chain-amino-acid transaminase [Nitrospirota bacterium]|nr:branched-chain-amino-acid transaminase [Nitrospirota bacterium]
MLRFGMLVYVNGKFVPKEEALVSVFDHGYLYGDGIYETLRAYNGKIFLLSKHLARLKLSAEAIGLNLPLTLDKIGDALREALTVNKLREAYMRIQVSRGTGDIGLDPALCPAPSMVIITKPFKDYPEDLYAKGVEVSIVNTRRNHPASLSPSIKSTNFLNNILAKIESLKAGSYEGILLNWEGYVAEGTISNIFHVKKGVLYTPDLKTGILEGVTRDLVMHLARKERIPVKEAQIKPRELADADECFLTNTTVEVLPVTRIDGKDVGAGTPGAITARLMAAYRDEVTKHV